MKPFCEHWIVNDTNLVGCYSLLEKPFKDNRGTFQRSFCQTEFGWSPAQINHVVNEAPYTLRGLHWQLETQRKFIVCFTGQAVAIVVDMRRASKTHKQHTQVTLRPGNALLIPPLCAAGYLTTAPYTELMYAISTVYNPELEAGARWNDPGLGIRLPYKPQVISEKDLNWPEV